MARTLLAELVEINTTVSFGSTKAAEAMASRLRAGGIPEKNFLLLGARPDRMNLVVRLQGRGQGKPMLLLAHLDVVEAPVEGWSQGVEPFRLTERDGWFYGRGVVDNKHAAAQLVTNIIRLHAEGFIPNRDILVALTADEEAGNANGVYWLAQERKDLTDVAYCLNFDSGGGNLEEGRHVVMSVQTSEKVYMSFRLETQSPGGHSSLPFGKNAIYQLAEGLARLSVYQFPFRFNETTRTYFRRIAETKKGGFADDLRALASDSPDLGAARRVAASSAYLNAILHTTCAATRLEAGHADNALPQSARAIVNCRTFPGDSREFVQRMIVDALADTGITVTASAAGQPSPVSPMLPEVMEPVERTATALWPGNAVVPVMDPWATDGARLRRAGIPTFGVSGTFVGEDGGNAHGANERLPVTSYYEGLEFMYVLLKDLSSSSQATHYRR